MVDLLFLFTPGTLFFQSYIYTYNFSVYDDVMDTRRHLLDALAMLTFLFTAIAIYKCYAPCHRERRHTVCTDQGRSQDASATSDTHLHEKPKVLPEDTLLYPQVVLTDSFPVYQGQQYSKEREHFNYELTNQQRFDKKSTNQNSCDKCLINKPINEHKEYTKTVKNVNNTRVSKEYKAENPVTAKVGGAYHSSALWDMSGVMVVLLDTVVVTMCLNYLWVFLKYYKLYYWTFTTLAGVFETVLVPVMVMCIEVTLSVARTLSTVFKIVDQNRESESAADRVSEQTTTGKHLVVLQM